MDESNITGTGQYVGGIQGGCVAVYTTVVIENCKVLRSNISGTQDVDYIHGKSSVDGDKISNCIHDGTTIQTGT